MKREYMIPILTLLMLLLTVVDLKAGNPEKYRIEFMNCKRILVGDKWLRVNDIFEDPMTIHWQNGKQFMRVRSLQTQKEYSLNKEMFVEAKVQNLHDFLFKSKSPSTRGYSFVLHYSQINHYLVDTLHFQAFDEPQPDVVTEAVWKKDDGSEQVTKLKRTTDNAFYIVTRKILGTGKAPDSLRLDIRERSIKENWTNRIYRQIPIRCLPLSIKE